MRIGISGRTSDVGRIEEQARDAEAVGFRSLWYAGGGGGDAVAAAAFAGRATTTIEVGTAVIATYPTHPVQLAARAAFASEASGGRFTLGIGPSHQFSMEQMYGLQQTRPGCLTTAGPSGQPCAQHRLTPGRATSPPVVWDGPRTCLASVNTARPGCSSEARKPDERRIHSKDAASRPRA